MKHLTQTQIQELQNSLLSKKKEIASLIERLERDDPFKDPEAALRSPAPDTDIREEQGHMNIRSQIRSLAHEQSEIDNALLKFSTQKYGICENSGEEISFTRLQIVPWTKYCVECEGKLVHSQK